MEKMSTDVDHQLLKITQHDKFYARLLSKESSQANPSFRVYYCGTGGAVPFVWESQPGTPKKTDTATPLPPLPPPPSHHSNPNNNKKQPSKGFIRCMVSRLIKRSPRTSTPLAPSASVSPRPSTSRYSSPGSSFSSMGEASVDLPDRERSTSSSTPWARHPVATVRNVLLSMVCRAPGSDRDAAA